MNFKDFFNFESKKVVRKEQKVIDYDLPLYRGFRGDLNNLEREGDYYIFSPKKSEQGMLWFASPFTVGYNPIEYARNHGDWFFEYILPVKKHVEIDHYEDGSTYNGTPSYFNKLVNPLENNRYYAGIELPVGWVWTYKHEKFVGCLVKIKVKISDVVAA